MKAKVGHYDIVSELGRGGMGVVYKGYEEALGRYVAIKQLSPSLAHDESIKQRFLREARAMAALNDPHIVQIYLIGEDDDQPFFAMEFVEGESLSTLLKREGRMSPSHAARIVFQTAQGLATAHAKGVIHRDIKPGNLLLNQRGMLKIADFGIALSASDSLANKLTATGGFVGTPGYLSPEVCMGKPVDARADIFALGIVLFELLTGRMPFRDESPLGLMLEVVQTEIPDIRELNGEVDAELAAILTRMTAKDPDQRYASAEELSAALGEHPLVTRNAAVTARIEMSPAAATMLAPMTPIPESMLTPASAQAFGTGSASQAATRAATPAQGGIGVVLPLAAAGGQELATQQQELSPMARPSALARPDRQNSSNGVWLAVAVAILLIAGGAWATRGTWLPGSSGQGVSTAGVGGGGNGAAAAGATAAAAAGATGLIAAAEPTEKERAERAAVVADYVAAVSEPVAATGDSGQNSADSGATGSVDAAADAGARVALAETSRPPPPPTRVERAVDRVAERRAERREAREPVAVSTVSRRIAIVTVGDTAVTGPARHMLEEALADSGFEVLDADMAGVGDLSASEIPRAVGHLAQRQGIGAAVVIRADPSGTQQLNYYGRSSEMYTAQLSVKLYDGKSRSTLGSGFRAPVNYTGPTADFNTREALEPSLRGMLDTLARYRDPNRG